MTNPQERMVEADRFHLNSLELNQVQVFASLPRPDERQLPTVITGWNEFDDAPVWRVSTGERMWAVAGSLAAALGMLENVSQIGGVYVRHSRGESDGRLYRVELSRSA